MRLSLNHGTLKLGFSVSEMAGAVVVREFQAAMMPNVDVSQTDPRFLEVRQACLQHGATNVDEALTAVAELLKVEVLRALVAACATSFSARISARLKLTGITWSEDACLAARIGARPLEELLRERHPDWDSFMRAHLIRPPLSRPQLQELMSKELDFMAERPAVSRAVEAVA